MALIWFVIFYFSMVDKFCLDQETIDPDSVERFNQYDSPDPYNINRQLFKEDRRDNRIKVKNAGGQFCRYHFNHNYRLSPYIFIFLYISF